MRKLIVVLLFVSFSFVVKAQYHLLYFSDDSITKMIEDADFFFRQNKYNESDSVYQKLSEVDSLRAMSIYKIGVNMYYAENYDSSFYYLKEAMTLGYDSLTVYWDMFFIYDNKLKEYQKAFNLLTEMIGYWPNNPKPYRERSLKRLQLWRDIKGSKSDLEKAANLGDEVAKEGLKNYK